MRGAQFDVTPAGTLYSVQKIDFIAASNGNVCLETDRVTCTIGNFA